MKTKIILIYIFLVVCAMHSTRMLSQITNNYYDFVPSSPNMTELSKFSFMPISYYTGIPDISIPLGNLTCGTLKLPVSISYYAGGIKVDQVASNVGLGWSLNAGGTIAQSVHKEDDLTNSSRILLSDEEVNKGKHLSRDEMFSLKLSSVDCEPDVFSYNFMGHTGQFLMDKNRKFYEIRGKQDFAIEYKDFAFVLTDLYGNKYTFSGIETCETCTHLYNCSFSENKLYKAGSDSRRYNVPTGYYLTKIQDPSGKHVISFYYAKECYTVAGRLEGSLFFDVQNAKEGKTGWKENGTLDKESPEGTHLANVPEGNFYQTSITYNALRLDRIETSSGESCHVIYSDVDRKDLPGCKPIKEITIASQKAVPSRWIFGHEYFESRTKLLDGSNLAVNYRLKLKNIKRISLDEKQSRTYCFAYYGEKDDEPALPFRNAFCGQDMWGYCNGNPTSNDAIKISRLFPTLKKINFQDNESITMGGLSGQFDVTKALPFPQGSNREVSAKYAHAYSLKRITYPTGRSSLFEYEPNDYYYAGSRIVGLSYAGGLRIRKITHIGENGISLSQKYEYSKENNVGAAISTGVLTNVPMHIVQKPLLLTNSKVGAPLYDIFLKFSSNSFTPAYTVGGDYIGYEEVTEITSEGKTVYGFTTSKNAAQNYGVNLLLQLGADYFENYASAPYPAVYSKGDSWYLYEPTPNGFYGNTYQRGLLTFKGIYDNKGQLVRKVSYKYTDTLIRNLYGLEPFWFYQNNETAVVKEHASASMYKIPVGKSVKTSTESIEYRNGVAMRQEQRYSYNAYDLPSKTVAIYNDGDSTIATTNYPSELEYGVYPIMSSKRILAYPVETIINHGGKAYDMRLKTYEENKGMYLPMEEYVLTLNKLASIVAYNGKNRDVHYAIPDLKVMSYDNQGNILATIDRNGKKHVFAWNVHGQLLLHIENTVLSEVLVYCPKIQDGQVTDAQISQLRLGLKNSFVTSYKYKLGNIISITDCRNQTTSYSYDGFGRLVEERDNDGNITKVYKYKIAVENELH